MDLKSDPLAFYQAVQAAVRANSGKTLAPLLKRWRYTPAPTTLEQHLADVRAADLLAFAVSGERAGAAEIARAEAALKASRGLRGLLAATVDELKALGFAETAAARIQAIAKICQAW